MTSSFAVSEPGACSSGSVLLERLFDAVAHKSAHFTSNIDPGWVDLAWGGLSADAPARHSEHATRLASSALQAVYQVRWPSLAALVLRVNRLAVLPLSQVLRVLHAVALYQRRGDVRRCIGRNARLALVDAVGKTAFDVIVAAPGTDTSHEGEIRVDAASLRVLERSAFQTLESRGVWQCTDARRLVSLCLAPAASGVVAGPSDSAQPAAHFHRFIEQLDLLFPEHAWLFGCDMDKALSASSTA
jgi:Bacterial type III secretion protein (HrpB4)